MPLPSIQKLSKLYDTFLAGNVSEEILVLSSQWARFDARLGEIMIKFLAKNWQAFNPMQLNRLLQSTKWPAAFGVILSHVQEFERQSSDPLLNAFVKLVMTNIPRAGNELFFINLRSIGSQRQDQEVYYAIDIYRAWGFLWSQPMVILKNKTRLKKHQRLRMLQAFIQDYKSFKVADYMKQCRGLITRRQAQRDLSTLESNGFTRSKIYLTLKNNRV